MPKGKSPTSSPEPEKTQPPGEFTFVVHGRPVPKGRPRMTRRGRVYTPKETILAEEQVVEAINQADTVPEFSGPVSVMMIFEKDSTIVKVRSMNDTSTKLRGDLDNYIKLLMDGIQRSPLIENDRQVMHIDAVKI